MNNLYNEDIREEFVRMYQAEEFVIDKSGVEVVEILGSSFIADEPTIFGTVNEDWSRRELAWYDSQSLNVNDIPAPVPSIWKQVATPEGLINSNYGWCIYSSSNGYQYRHALGSLLKDPFSRRAEMIYTRPTMHEIYNSGGMSDFICTEAVQYFIRDNKLHVVVKMRSNDAIHGFKGDFFWQKTVQERLLSDLNIAGRNSYKPGLIYWSAGSLHIYKRHFNLIEEYIQK